MSQIEPSFIVEFRKKGESQSRIQLTVKHFRRSRWYYINTEVLYEYYFILSNLDSKTE